MKKVKDGLDSIDLEELASIDDSRMREALCDAAISSCQRKLHKKEIKESARDIGKIRAELKERIPLYQRMEGIYRIKGDAASAGYYRILEEAIRSAVIKGELSEQQNDRRSKDAKPDARKQNRIKSKGQR